jgi:regulator of nucleoside diphosphate kinase
MHKARRCQLTAKDANILEVMLERRGHDDDGFTRLLREKVVMASVALFDGIDPRAATINSRVEYSIDGGPPCKRILVYGGENAYPGMTLPITTMRGLALLGLVAPESITVMIQMDVPRKSV